MVDHTSPMPGRWRLANSPWVKDLMECFQDDSINDISIMCSAQSSKTQTIMVLLLWVIACSPGPAMWVMADREEAKTFMRTRLQEAFDECEPVKLKLPTDRHGRKILEINFSNMPFMAIGSNSKSKLQSKPVKYLFLDEVRNYPPGAFEMVGKRTRTFWNYRKIIISTPAMREDHVHRAFLAGDQRYYYVPCPACRKEQHLVWAQMKWDETDFTRPNGQWNYDALAETVRYECVHCAHKIPDQAPIRREMGASGRWVRHNLNAPSNRVSFTWNAMLPHWVKWRDLVEEFLKAKDAIKVGAVEPLKSFITESLGEPWEERYEEEREEIVVSDYKKDDVWPEESQRFITVDVQKDHFWAVCRAWARSGESKLVWEGKMLTFEEIHDLQLRLQIKGWRVLIDSGYNATQIYEQCVKYKWIALKGEDREYFSHHKKGKSFRRIYSTQQRGDPGIGKSTQGMKSCPLFLWSNSAAKDILDRLKRNQGALWGIYKDVSAEYLSQMDSETKKLKHHRETGKERYVWVRIGRRPNHLWDCECMQIVAANMTGLLNISGEVQEDVNMLTPLA